MRPTLRFRARRLFAPLAAVALVVGISPFVIADNAGAATFGPALACPNETYPPAGSPRSDPDHPYAAQFTASLGVAANNADGGDGGFIEVKSPNALGMATITLGPPDAASTTGTLFGEACGTFALPSLHGLISNLTPGQVNGVDAPGGFGGSVSRGSNVGNSLYNRNFILHGAPFGSGGIGNQISVGLSIAGLGVNLTTLKGSGSADGDIINLIEPQAAANGGLNVSFMTTAKATADVDPSALLSMISGSALSALTNLLGTGAMALGASTGGECTLSLGNQNLVGYAGNTAGYTQPATLSTTDTKDGGRPLTGPITDAQGVAAASGILQPPIEPGSTPDPLAPGAATTAPTSLCTPTIAGLFNGLLGLPYAPGGTPGGVDTFVAPLTVRTTAPL